MFCDNSPVQHYRPRPAVASVLAPWFPHREGCPPPDQTRGFWGVARKHNYNLQMSETFVDPEAAIIRPSKHGFAIEDLLWRMVFKEGSEHPLRSAAGCVGRAASGRCVSKGQAGVWGSSVRNGVKLPSRLISSCCVPAEAARGNCWGGVHQRSDDPPSLLMVPDPQGQHKLRHKEIWLCNYLQVWPQRPIVAGLGAPRRGWSRCQCPPSCVINRCS